MFQSCTKILLLCTVVANCESMKDKDSYKDQYCTDPRTMQKHDAYTEWADAYSCTRHRCQPGGGNLAIYTVGCKRVEAPESAIECEEVVEDTNMQFPYCCTRLRCLVVVRGEVWTKVFGQPWEVLPAAPWSHMYKMKKPPPTERDFVDKPLAAGPVYEIGADADNDNKDYEDKDQVMRSGSRAGGGGRSQEYKDSPSPSIPDIVIAVETNPRDKLGPMRKKVQTRKLLPENLEDSLPEKRADQRDYDVPDYDNYGNEKDQQPNSQEGDVKEYKPSNLQDLVDAIGTRMRDIENVVQKMAEKVPKKPSYDDGRNNYEVGFDTKPYSNGRKRKSKKSGSDFKRFSVRNRGNKSAMRSNDGAPENPSGYYSDSANIVVRSKSKDPALATYMAPVDTRRKGVIADSSDHDHTGRIEQESENNARKKKRRSHRKHHGKSTQRHKRHGKRRLIKQASIEADRNIVSIEESSGSHIIL